MTYTERLSPSVDAPVSPHSPCSQSCRTAPPTRGATTTRQPPRHRRRSIFVTLPRIWGPIRGFQPPPLAPGHAVSSRWEHPWARCPAGAPARPRHRCGERRRCGGVGAWHGGAGKPSAPRAVVALLVAKSTERCASERAGSVAPAAAPAASVPTSNSGTISTISTTKIVAPIRRSLTRRSMDPRVQVRTGARSIFGNALRRQQAAVLEPIERRSHGVERTEHDDAVAWSRRPQRRRACRRDAVRSRQSALRNIGAIRAANVAPLVPRATLRRGKPPRIDAVAQLRGDARRILVRKDSTHRERPARARQRAQILREHSRGIGIVGHVQYPRRPCGDPARRHPRGARIDHLKSSDQPHGGSTRAQPPPPAGRDAHRAPRKRRWQPRRCANWMSPRSAGEGRSGSSQRVPR